MNTHSFYPSRIVFLSFADSRMDVARSRVFEQAVSMSLFDEIKLFDENSLDLSFRESFKNVLIIGMRKFGYCCWKPQIMLQVLRELNDDDIVLYCDIGCHLNSRGREILRTAFKEFQLAKNKYLMVTQTGNCEAHYTKGDTFDFFNVTENNSITHSKQIQSGICAAKKTPFSETFLNKWLDIYKSNFDLATDTPSKKPNFDGFIENRTQSFLSLLCKTNPDGIMFKNNIYKYYRSNDIENKQKASEPILTLRDVGLKGKYNTIKII